MKDRFTVISGKTRASAASTANDWRQVTDEKNAGSERARLAGVRRSAIESEEVRLRAADTLQDARDRAAQVLTTRATTARRRSTALALRLTAL